ncbi:MAG: DUF2505 domain-containing protein [Deltaproteobacteria bacterium]|nr:MAG: DUF2505 domain-containing protein [Deltaproteobacteria bacterium]
MRSRGEAPGRGRRVARGSAAGGTGGDRRSTPPGDAPGQRPGGLGPSGPPRPRSRWSPPPHRGPSMKLELRHRFPVPPEIAWRELFGEAYESAVSEQAKLQRTVLEDRLETGDVGPRRIRRIHVVPDQRLPAAVARVIGTDRFSYVLEEHHDRDTHRMDFTVTPDGLADRVSVRGSWTLRPAPEGCERHVTIEIQVKVPVIGGRIEQQIAADLQESYESAAHFARDWLTRVATETS